MDVSSRLQVDNAELRAENRYLRQIARTSPDGRRLRRTLADAKQLVIWRWSGLSITRRDCESYGMSRRRWQWANALLEYARIRVKGEWHILDFELVIERLDASTTILEARGLDMLRLRLPFSVRFEGKKTGNSLGTREKQTVPSSREGKKISSGDYGAAPRNRQAEIEARHQVRG